MLSVSIAASNQVNTRLLSMLVEDPAASGERAELAGNNRRGNVRKIQKIEQFLLS